MEFANKEYLFLLLLLIPYLLWYLMYRKKSEPTIRMRADEFPRYLELVEEARAAMPRGFVGLGLEADFHTPLVPDWLRKHFDAAPFDLRMDDRSM